MDVFIEYMVKRKKSILEHVEIVTIAILGGVVLQTALAILLKIFPMFGPLIAFAVFAGIYFLYIWCTSFNVEYEYSIVNNEMDIFKIVNERKRKQLSVVNIKTIEKFGQSGNNFEFEQAMKNPEITKIYACINKSAKDVYFAVYREGDGKKMLLFNPNEKMVAHIEKIYSRNIAV